MTDKSYVARCPTWKLECQGSEIDNKTTGTMYGDDDDYVVRGGGPRRAGERAFVIIESGRVKEFEWKSGMALLGLFESSKLDEKVLKGLFIRKVTGRGRVRFLPEL